MAFDWNLGNVIDGFLGLFGLGNSAANRRSQENMNQINLDYAKAMTEKQWERDDTSYQRSVEDAVKAGFSPLAVLEGGLTPNGSPVGFQGIAPQFDSNAFLNAMSNLSSDIKQKSMEEFKTNQDLIKLQKQFEDSIDLAEKMSSLNKDEESYKTSESLKYLKEATKLRKNETEQKEMLERIKQLGVVGTQRCESPEEASRLYKEWISSFTLKSEEYFTIVRQSTDSDEESLTSEFSLKDVAKTGGAIKTASSMTLTESQARSYNDYMKTWFVSNPMPLNPDGTIPDVYPTSRNNSHAR